jgi:hypothetical protein
VISWGGEKQDSKNKRSHIGGPGEGNSKYTTIFDARQSTEKKKAKKIGDFGLTIDD